jgi:hypothetical protein
VAFKRLLLLDFLEFSKGVACTLTSICSLQLHTDGQGFQYNRFYVSFFYFICRTILALMMIKNCLACLAIILFSACANEHANPKESTHSDTVNLSVDEKIEASRKQKESELNMSSAVRFAASKKEYARWGEMAMMSKYGKLAHNLGYTLLTPTSEMLLALDPGYLEILVDEKNKDLLDELMGHYLVLGSIDYVGLAKLTEVEMANGQKLKVDPTLHKIGEIQLAPIEFATSNGQVIQTTNIPYFPMAELEKRYVALKRKKN